MPAIKPRENSRRRLFFALWPDDRTRRAVVRLLRALPRRRGRPVKAENLHITLIFAGHVDEIACRCLADSAVGLEIPAFVLRLARLGYFSRTRILWLAPEAGPPELEALVEGLGARLAPCGHRPEARTYHPHLTLMRHAAPARTETAVATIDWRVEEFCLVESQTLAEGARYRILRRYPLAS